MLLPPEMENSSRELSRKEVRVIRTRQSLRFTAGEGWAGKGGAQLPQLRWASQFEKYIFHCLFFPPLIRINRN